VNPDWPFDQAPETAAIVTRAVLDGGPILLVSHDEDDEGWQFLDGDAPDESEARIISMRQALDRDPSLRLIADLPVGWVAWRDSPADPWSRQPAE
jgi:hypothetical protein